MAAPIPRMRPSPSKWPSRALASIGSARAASTPGPACRTTGCSTWSTASSRCTESLSQTLHRCSAGVTLAARCSTPLRGSPRWPRRDRASPSRSSCPEEAPPTSEPPQWPSAGLELDPQQLRRSLTEHRSALRGGEARRFEYVVDRLRLPRDRMVGADDELADADFRGQVPQRFRGEDQRVVIHLPQILGRLLLQLDAGVHVGRDAQAVVGARRVGRQVAAAVCRADLESGEAIERALEDQMRERDGGVQRVADRVRQPAVALEAPGEVWRALRMDEDQHAELLGLGQERVELRAGELVAGDARADGGAAEPELLDAFHELLHRQVRELERDRGEGDEAVRVGRAELGEPLVLDLDHLSGDVALGPVPRGVDADRLHVDALGVHLADPTGPDLVDPRTARDVGFQPEQRLRLRDHAVGVHVDHLHAATADDHFAAPAGRLHVAARRYRLGARLPARRRPRRGSRPRSGRSGQIASGEGDAGHRADRVSLEHFATGHRDLLSAAFRRHRDAAPMILHFQRRWTWSCLLARFGAVFRHDVASMLPFHASAPIARRLSAREADPIVLASTPWSDPSPWRGPCTMRGWIMAGDQQLLDGFARVALAPAVPQPGESLPGSTPALSAGPLTGTAAAGKPWTHLRPTLRAALFEGASAEVFAA